MAHPPAVTGGSPLDFARIFGDAVQRFLDDRDMKQSDAAKQMGLEGTNGKSKLNTYCHDSPRGTRTMASAEIFYLLCTRLGFKFEHNGYRILAVALNGKSRRAAAPVPEQMTFKFDRKFNLTDEDGTVAVTVHRPPGRIELSVSLKANKTP